MGAKGTADLEVLLTKGWQVLVNELGHEGALRFIMSVERGEGDSVKELHDIWGSKTAREIHEEIMKAKRSKRL
ncbi:MAG: hypothetical protein HY204_10040 [Nitrospirae bacterium]|nr:hypothetical protein [Nitrospirota bacterium]